MIQWIWIWIHKAFISKSIGDVLVNANCYVWMFGCLDEGVFVLAHSEP